jgi:hypothetical protein
MPEPLLDIRAFMSLRNNERCWAVGEYQKYGGFTSYRFCFPIEHPLSGNHSIVSQNHTYQEAKDLCALTPEIVRLLAAVEAADSWKQDAIILGHLYKAHHLTWPTLGKIREAISDIQDDRCIRNQNGYTPLIPFSVVAIEIATNEKEELMKYILETFKSPDGSVGNLEVVYQLLNKKISETIIRNRVDE